MKESHLLSLYRLLAIALATLLVILIACVFVGRPGRAVPAASAVASDRAVSLAVATASAPVGAEPGRATPKSPEDSVAITTTVDLPIAPVAGALAPDFALVGLDGDEVSLSDLRGQVVLLNFWTTW